MSNENKSTVFQTTKASRLNYRNQNELQFDTENVRCILHIQGI